MQLITTTLKSISALILASGLLCGNASAQSAPHDEAHHPAKKMDWPGIYNGFLPCADCMGLKTSLALNKNGSYILITQYVGRSPRDFVEKGKYSVDEASQTISLTPRKAGDTHQYRIGDGQLMQLDDHGKAYTGELASRYVLRRTDVTENPPEHAH
ncbi:MULTISPECIES: copper resistance protein NlpE [Methylomonas]|uniref:copper resistance protein NlpE n=1 Tax=Methylomonas TaxID=416 RepID=UPI0012320C35|nr:copper resistance protein NlpE [Methylomonas rhizoryzae]